MINLNKLYSLEEGEFIRNVKLSDSFESSFTIYICIYARRNIYVLIVYTCWKGVDDIKFECVYHCVLVIQIDIYNIYIYD